VAPATLSSSADQLKALKDPKVLKYCQYYSIVFGGYVALSLWMVQYYVGEFGLDIRVAALLAACFSLPGGVLRAIGGVLSDKYGAHSVTWWVMWVSWICLFLLSYPQTEMTILTTSRPRTFHIGLNVYLFTALMFMLGICLGLRQGQRLQVHQRRLRRTTSARSAASWAWPAAWAASCCPSCSAR
jgi:NNP family nitrate/nitrite transporter-like MFS transporter